MYIYDEKERGDNRPRQYDEKTFVVSKNEKYFFNDKLRWCNLGSHYDWDNRCYFKDSYSTIPEYMKSLCERVV